MPYNTCPIIRPTDASPDQGLDDELLYPGTATDRLPRQLPPRLCGLATFTADLRDAVSRAAPEAECFALAMTDGDGPYGYPPEVRLEISEADPSSYERAAEFVNDANVDVLCVQHEFGIYGGAAGGLLLSLLERARMPVVATLHTVLERPIQLNTASWPKSSGALRASSS